MELFWQLKVTVAIKRPIISELLVTFAPCVILTMVAISTYCIPVDDLNDRLTVSVSNLIVMASLLTTVSIDGLATVGFDDREYRRPGHHVY